MKIICISESINRHVKELNNNRPDSPVIFLKPDTSLLKNQPFLFGFL